MNFFIFFYVNCSRNTAQLILLILHDFWLARRKEMFVISFENWWRKGKLFGISQRNISYNLLVPILRWDLGNATLFNGEKGL